jgi:hypothetical protein
MHWTYDCSFSFEQAKAILRTWGAAEPNFLLTNSKLTFQMTMIPEKTQYLTQGPDGVRKLREGPNIGSYRGLKIINSRAFSMEEGAPPRDVLRRRVRVAEYYRIPYERNVEQKSFAFYDESKVSFYSHVTLFSLSDILDTHCVFGITTGRLAEVLLVRLVPHVADWGHCRAGRQHILGRRGRLLRQAHDQAAQLRAH